MILELKQFIEDNIDLISDNKFNDVYNKIKSYKFTRLFTEAMLEADINPLNYMEDVPKRYLDGSSISAVNIPVGITHIREYSFARCSNLEEIDIPEGVAYILEGAFMNCSKVERIHLPSTLKFIDFSVFAGCTSLKQVTFAGTVDYWVNVVTVLDDSLLQFEPIKCSDN